jgi:hypothetical protein
MCRPKSRSARSSPSTLSGRPVVKARASASVFPWRCDRCPNATVAINTDCTAGTRAARHEEKEQPMTQTLTYQHTGAPVRGQAHALFAQTMAYVAPGALSRAS